MLTFVYVFMKIMHLLGAVLWVGGMFFALIVLRPSLATIDAPQRMLLQTQVHNKFFRVIWHVMPIVLVSGLLMLWLRGGMAYVTWPIHVMLLLGLVMSGIFLAIVFGPWRKFRRTIDRTRMAASLDTVRKLVSINLIIGLIVVLLAGLL